MSTFPCPILYEDDVLIAVNKPALLPTQDDPTADTSLANAVSTELQHKIHVLHRLDRPTSGIVLFAKTEAAATHLSEQFKNRQTEKTYLAVVENLPTASNILLSSKGTSAEGADSTGGSLVHFLKENKEKNKTYIAQATDKGAKRAELRYILRGSSDRYHLLEIDLLTGRHHQIRAQLGAIGCPIKGDVKYGARRANPDRSIHLHAWRLAFRHPVSYDKMILEADLPIENLWAFFKIQLQA
jgi:23S rRNA pseudouridine1911/1915/1917 synthase